MPSILKYLTCFFVPRRGATEALRTGGGAKGRENPPTCAVRRKSETERAPKMKLKLSPPRKNSSEASLPGQKRSATSASHRNNTEQQACKAHQSDSTKKGGGNKKKECDARPRKWRNPATEKTIQDARNQTPATEESNMQAALRGQK